MDEKLKQLTLKKQRLDTYRPLPQELVKNLDDWFKVELTYTSNAIEGNTLTRAETALVVEKGLTVQGKSLTEHLEATNHAEALDFVKTLAHKARQDITEQDILNIHRLILNKVEAGNAGRYRTQHARLTEADVVLPHPIKVPDLMEEFIKWLVGDNPDHIVKIGADAHYKLVSIHPFSDGNGRTSRLLMNLLLMQQGYPPAIIRKEEGKGLDDFYNLIYGAVDRSLDIYLEAVELTPKQRFYTTEEVAKLLQVDPESVRRYVRSNQLRAVRLGGKFIRVDRADLDKFIEGLKS